MDDNRDILCVRLALYLRLVRWNTDAAVHDILMKSIAELQDELERRRARRSV